MFTLNGKVWQISLVKPYSRFLRRPNGTYSFGCTDRNLRMIYIADNLDEETMQRVLMHELCHSLIESFDLDLSVAQEEAVCFMFEIFGDDLVVFRNKILESLGY